MTLRFLFATIVLIALETVLADEATDRRRDELLRQMRSQAEQTKIEFAGSDRQPELLKNPVFRYDDQPRRFIDATVWVWTDAGRPVAFQKIEAVEDGRVGIPTPLWQTCFTSLAADKLSVEWSAERKFASSEPGIQWAPVPAAPAPASRGAERKRQARSLARGFAGRIVLNPETNHSAEIRLMPTPMLEYDGGETGLVQGAVFGFSVYGTNPDVLVLLEIRERDGKQQWHFAAARMTTGGITLIYLDKKVWEAEFVPPVSGPYPTWTFFSKPRAPLVLEDKP